MHRAVHIGLYRAVHRAELSIGMCETVHRAVHSISVGTGGGKGRDWVHVPHLIESIN